MLYDTHAHPYLNTKKEMREILSRFFSHDKNNKLNAVATDFEDIPKVLEISQAYPNIYATVGLHPTSITSDMSAESVYQRLLSIYEQNSEHIVAIGECGLDYYHINDQATQNGCSIEEMKLKQKEIFKAQIRLAKKLEIPFIIHNRDSGKDVMDILKSENATNFVFHCFSEDSEYAQKILELSPRAMFGIGGVVTFKNAKTLQKAVENIPLQNIVLETDEPFLTPTPLRGREENEPLYTKHVLDYLADLLEVEEKKLERIFYDNAMKLFHKKNEI